MRQVAPQVGVIVLGDPHQLGLPAGAFLSWHQTQGSGKLPPTSEHAAAPERHGQGRRGEHPDARNGRETPTNWMLSMPDGEFCSSCVA